jgi:predicted branched-subunit amino acid permease
MTHITPNSRAAFWRGFKAATPFILVVIPFALLFGVLAQEAGLNVLQLMSMSVLVIAGAAQLTALALLQEHAPTAIILVTALAVNLRMAMYSAALAPHIGKASIWARLLISYFLVDQSFAMAVQEYEDRPEMTINEKIAFFFGTMVPIAPLWYGATLAGALLGSQIPPEFSLDFAVPICFIAITGPMLRTPAHIIAAVVSIVVALSLAWIPYSMGLLVASVLAMVAGAQTEVYLQRGRSNA